MNSKYNVVDLFCGMGGGAIGIEKVGRFKTLLAIDYENAMVDTYNRNLKDKVAKQLDITKISIDEFKSLVNGEHIDILMGSPSCQGFTMLTRNRNRMSEVNREKRNSLVYDFLRAVEAYRPTVCVIENVKGLLSMKDKNDNLVIDNIHKTFKNLGYYSKHKIVKAEMLGIAQKRHRVIIIAAKTEKLLNLIEYPKEFENNLTIKDIIDDLKDLPLNTNKVANHYTNITTKIVQERIKTIKEGEDSTNIPNNSPYKTKAKFTDTYKRHFYNEKLAL